MKLVLASDFCYVIIQRAYNVQMDIKRLFQIWYLYEAMEGAQRILLVQIWLSLFWL